jgi:hypothetical protein
MTSIANNGALEVRTSDGVKFGKELREKEFLFDKEYLPLNHGVYTVHSIVLAPGPRSVVFCCILFQSLP